MDDHLLIGTSRTQGALVARALSSAPGPLTRGIAGPEVVLGTTGPRLRLWALDDGGYPRFVAPGCAAEVPPQACCTLPFCDPAVLARVAVFAANEEATAVVAAARVRIAHSGAGPDGTNAEISTEGSPDACGPSRAVAALGALASSVCVRLAPCGHDPPAPSEPVGVIVVTGGSAAGVNELLGCADAAAARVRCQGGVRSRSPSC